VTTPDGPVAVPIADDASIGLKLPGITDEFMKEGLQQGQSYALCC
jgi:hypothetical protein